MTPSDDKPNVVQPAVCGLNNISKSFGAVQALKDVSFDVRQGEFLAIIGENGAGKSTAMSVLFGLLEPDTGHVEIAGHPKKMKSARDAIDAGFGMVHQHFKLYPELTVLENVIAGNEDTAGIGFIPFKQHRIKIQKIIDDFDFQLDLDVPVTHLGVSARQQLEIVKLLFRGASVVILDEPTAALTPQESAALYDMLGRLQSAGTSIVLITHKLDEVMDNSERILVMRHGELVGEFATAATDTAELTAAMVGRDIDTPLKENTVLPEVAVKVTGLTVDGLANKKTLRNVSFEVHAGEILGIAGVNGNGQKELINALVGLEIASSGQIEFNGQEIAGQSIAERRAAGVGYMAEDRITTGLAGRGSIAENLISGREHGEQFARRGYLRKSKIAEHARNLIDKFDIRTPSERQAAGNLSGGNQQKVVVARELSADPKFLVIENPCWGVDVGAIAFIHRQILDLAKSGCAIVLNSSDLEELFALCDRVGVMFDGELVEIFARDALNSFTIGARMSGDLASAQ